MTPGGINGAGISNAGDGSNGSPLGFTFLDDTTGILKTIEYDLYDAFGDGDMDIGRKVDSANRQAIAENISTLQFVYLKSDGTTTTQTSKIRSVRITIEASTDINQTDHTDGKTRTLTTVIKLRNLGL